MCNNHHDGACTGVLTRSEMQPNQMVMMLVCERCDEIVKVIGSFDHVFKPLIHALMPGNHNAPEHTDLPAVAASDGNGAYHRHDA